MMTRRAFVRKDRFPTISAIRESGARLAPTGPAVYHELMQPQSTASEDPGEGYSAALEATPGHVADIVAAAERAAAELREQGEARARERIAEADRAAANRVQAAEEEAQEILHAARSQAESARNDTLSVVGEIHAEAERVRSEARQEAEQMRESSQREAMRARTDAGLQAEEQLSLARAQAEEALASARAEAAGLLADAREQAERLLAGSREESARNLAHLQGKAEEQAQAIRAKARADAREIVGQAHAAAREVLRDGTVLSRELRELSVSLRNNAERLLRDVRLAHGGLTARLDQAVPGGGSIGPEEPGEDLDVPEFIRPHCQAGRDPDPAATSLSGTGCDVSAELMVALDSRAGGACDGAEAPGQANSAPCDFFDAPTCNWVYHSDSYGKRRDEEIWAGWPKIPRGGLPSTDSSV